MFNLTPAGTVTADSPRSLTLPRKDDKPPSHKPPFAQHHPNVLTRQVGRGHLGDLITLEDIRDDLRALKVSMQPEDRTFDLDTLAIGFPAGEALVTRLIGRDQRSKPVGVTEHGWKLLSGVLYRDSAGRKPLPQAHRLIRDMARRGLRGEQLATLVSTQYARAQSEGWLAGDAPRSHLFRLATINGKRVIRSVHSTRYAAYDNLDLADNLIEAIGGEARVLSCRVSDTGMVIKLTTTPESEITLDTPIPIIQAGNSEVGMRSAWIEGGLWKLICTNGMGSWQEHRSYKWRHTGDGNRITLGMLDAAENIQAASSGLLRDYDTALGTTINDAMAWMEAELHNVVPERVISRVREGMEDPTSSDPGTLANVIDGMTLIAQDDHLDPFAGWEIERQASRLMSRGLRQADRGNITVAQA